MSGGYTPLFSSIVTGTLYGRWPDIGLWPIVLAIADRHGTVDVTPHYLAGATGLPVEDVIACMKRFCEPDPYSRSKADGGSRLTLLDDHRDWGWQVVNHSKYREKARKASYDSQRTESGVDAERKRASRDVPTSPAMSRAVPLSDSDSDSDSDKNQDKKPRATRSAGHRLPEDFELTPERRKYAEAEGLDPDRLFLKFTNYWRAKAGANARKLDWNATWQNWCLTTTTLPGARNPTRRAKTADELDAEWEAANAAK